MTEAAKMYGGSLYDLAAEENRDVAILAQMDEVAALFAQNPDWLRLLCQPNLPKKERCGLLDEAFAASGVEPYLLNFLKLLTERGILGEFSGCCKEFRRRYNEAHGILEVTAYAAVPFTAEQTARLQQKLEAMTGKAVQLKTVADEKLGLLGGVQLDMGGVRLDGTVRSRLEAIGASIKNVTL